MTWRDALSLGRVSNLPTVWTNVLAAMALTAAAGTVPPASLIAAALIAMSLFYVGGMYLNDAFDAAIDAAERPERPIPAGRVGRGTVFAAGFALLSAGLAALAWAGYGVAGGTGPWPLLGGLVLAAAIVFYDWNHKANPLSPLVMGLCRVLVYVTAGLCLATSLPAALWVGAGLVLCHLIGLTYVAKQENLGRVETLWPLAFLAAPLVFGAWQAVSASPMTGVFAAALAAWVGVALRYVFRRGPGDIPRAVVSLIAGIALLDAMLIAATGNLPLAVAALGGFGLTLFLQRFVAGT